MDDYCAGLVRRLDYDRFLMSLFVPPVERPALLAMCALNAELAQVRSLVSEEMIGHIRLAWWQEALEGLYNGQPPRGQPVLEALAPLIASGRLPKADVMALVESYRATFPNAPENDAIIEKLALSLLSPQGQKGWSKAKSVIARHRARYGKSGNGWLSFKLLMAGVF